MTPAQDTTALDLITEALEAGRSIASDRSAGGRMLTSKEYAEKTVELIDRAAATLRVEAATWVGWHPKAGYAWETRSDSQQDAVAALMRSGRCAGKHDWEIRALGVVAQKKTP